MPEIAVKRTAVEQFQSRFEVTVEELDSTTRHEVTLARGDFERLGQNCRSPEELIIRCFEFLLEREPKESIMESFDISVIGRYFPEFEQEIGRR
jgi:hypothetical protein